MYNIKQAAARAGVSVPVLRAWERRYGIVSPPRTASGYRRFDDETVARVRTMRSLVEAGWSPSAAAAAILAGEVPVAAEIGLPVAPGADRTGAPSTPRQAEELVARLVGAARAVDAAALEGVLDDIFSRGSFERVAGDVLFPALEQLGEAWAAGTVSVAGEHLASAAVHRRLGLALEAAGTAEAGGSHIVVGLPPGSRHELGAMAFAVAARRSGLSVAYVGADLPVADWVTAAAGADAVVVGIVTPRDRRAGLEVAHALRGADPSLVIAFGGDAAPSEAGVIALPAPLPDAVRTLSEALPAHSR